MTTRNEIYSEAKKLSLKWKISLTIKWSKGTKKEWIFELDRIKKIIESCKDNMNKIHAQIKKNSQNPESSINKLNNEGSCSICFDNNNNSIELHCGHKFHHHCIRRLYYIFKSNKCPLCRKEFDYKLNKNNKKMYSKLKHQIIKNITSKHNRINFHDLMRTAIYLQKKDIDIELFHRLIGSFKELEEMEHEYYIYKYVEYDISNIYFFQSPFPQKCCEIIILTNFCKKCDQFKCDIKYT